MLYNPHTSRYLAPETVTCQAFFGTDRERKRERDQRGRNLHTGYDKENNLEEVMDAEG